MDAIKRFLGKVKSIFGSSKKENEKTIENINQATKEGFENTKHIGMPRHEVGLTPFQMQMKAKERNKINKRRRLNKIGHENRRINNQK